MYVYHNIEERSCNHCCGGQVMSSTQPVYLFVALGIHHAVRQIVICGLPRSASFFYIISQKEQFQGGGEVLNIKRVSSSSTTFVWNILHSALKWVRYQTCIMVFMYSALYSFSILMKLEFLLFFIIITYWNWVFTCSISYTSTGKTNNKYT